jgi:hypothetical protein
VENVEFSSRLNVKIFRSRLGERDGGLRGFCEIRSFLLRGGNFPGFPVVFLAFSFLWWMVVKLL